MKRSIALLLTAALVFALLLSACSGKQNGEANPEETARSAEDSEIIERFYANFLKLTEVPRPSHHEEKISRFLYDWASEKGYEVHQDESLNIIFDVPATKGMENLPLVALQGHMDMVAVAEDGVAFDPLNDPIHPIRDEKNDTVTADGTSLGADDGAGVATIMTLLESDAAHGPLRILITTNEEDGMTGVFGMDPKWVKEPKYLINIDAEDSTAIIVSTASGDLINGAKDVRTAAPQGNAALSVSISGLKGGHSGVEIDKKRCNGIAALAGFLRELSAQGVAFELASLEGGSASNAIPKNASCLIALDGADREKVQAAAGKYLEKLNADFAGIEDQIKFTVSDAELPAAVVSAEDADSAIALITEIIDGVHTMSADKEGLVESSSNLGLFALSEAGSTFVANVRSSVSEKQAEIIAAHLALAERCGYGVTQEKSADPWPYNPDNRLMNIAERIYKEQNGADLELIAVHAGLECGSFAVYNPELMMISLGPDLRDVHTPQETLTLSSVPKVYKLLTGILREVE